MSKKKCLISVCVLICMLIFTLPALSEGVLTLPPMLKTISEEAFLGNTSFQTVVFPEGLTVIPKKAFAESGLTEVTIPETIEDIAEDAFYGCESLEKIVVESKTVVLDDYSLGREGDTHLIYGYKGSTAEEYAKNNGLTFKYMDEGLDEDTGENILDRKRNHLLSCASHLIGFPESKMNTAEFVSFCFDYALGVSIDNTLSGIYSNTGGTKITSMSALQPGDIVCFRSSESSACDQVGIYVGAGTAASGSSYDAGIYIESSNGYGSVRYNYLGSSYYKSNFLCGWRIDWDSVTENNYGATEYELKMSMLLPYAQSLHGTSASQIDAAGLVSHVFDHVLDVPILSTCDGIYEYTAGDKITSISELQPGDVVCFKTDSSSDCDQVGIYIGAGTASNGTTYTTGIYIESSAGYGSVRYNYIPATGSGYYTRNFLCGWRVNLDQGTVEGGGEEGGEEGGESGGELDDIANKQIKKLLEYADGLVGTPYSQMDCVSFVNNCYRKALNIYIPYNCYGIYHNTNGTKITSVDALQPGDIICWMDDTDEDDDLYDCEHVGMYVGAGTVNGKYYSSGVFIESSRGHGAVRYKEFTSYYKRNFLCAWRIVL
ncbi:MAG: C40 family peptidase [Clostridia bacterium]|nr:C40 family peptidase [Clostridia bacterium]